MSSQSYSIKITLKDCHFVAKGQRCLVYQHPDVHNLLIKVLNPQFQQRNNLKNKLLKHLPGISRYRLTKYYLREFIEIMRLRSNHHDSSHRCLQQAVGLVNTNLGLGLVVIAERGQDGQYAKTLKSFIQANQYDEHLQNKVAAFCQELARNDITVTDCCPRNLVYAYNETDGDHFVLIDGIGEKNFIPFLRLSSYLRKKSRLKEIAALKRRIQASIIKYGERKET